MEASVGRVSSGLAILYFLTSPSCSYLLEKSRVVHQQDAERNYHYFYQIVAAAADNPELARTLLLSDADEHYYISQSSINVIEGVSDLEEFNEVQSAMEVCEQPIRRDD